MARVTVGLPVFNGEKYVESAVESLLQQTYRDLAIIIADNASTDATAAICRQLAEKDSRIIFLENGVNIGGWRNHNLVLERADSELFMWAGHDDLWEPEGVATCVDLLDSHPDAVMAFVGSRRIDGNGDPIPFEHVVPNFWFDSAPDRFREAIRLDYSLEMFYGVMRTEVAKRSARLGQFSDCDRVFIAELALQGKFANSPEPLFCRRDHSGRSIRQFTSRNSRNEWINPGSGTALGFPFTREWWELFKRVATVKLSLRDKLRSCWILGQWAIRYRRALLNDYRNFVRGVARRLSGSARSI